MGFVVVEKKNGRRIITCATRVIPSFTRGQSLRMKPYRRNLCSELSATPVIGPVVAGDSTTARNGRR